MDIENPPITPLTYLRGLNVVDIGDIRVARGMTRREHSSCRHRQLVYDAKERRVWCKDCEHTIDAFDAFVLIAEQCGAAIIDIERRYRLVADAEKHNVRLIAAKVMDEAWQSRNTVPCCPHCGHGIFPEDVRNGLSTKGKDYARKQNERPTPPPASDA